MSTKASMNHYLGGQVKVCVFVPCIFFVLYYSYHSVLPETVSLEMDLRTTYVTRSLSATSLFITNFPFVSSCHLRGKKGNMNTGTSGRRERGKLVGWLERWVLREGSQPFQRKKMTDSECLYCWQTWAPRGGWGERARMAKDVPEWGQQTRSSKLCHHQNYKGAKRVLSLWLHFWTLTLVTHKCLVHLKSMWTIWNSEKRKYCSSCVEIIGPVYEWFDVQWIYKGSLQKMCRGLGVLTPPDKLLIK